MTPLALLKEALKDPILREKYGIPEEELAKVSFDTTSNHPIIETLKTIILLKDNGTSDVNTFKSIKQNQFKIKD